MANPAHVIIAGGVSVNDPGGHDKFPYNFINPAARRAIEFKKNAHVILFTPPYEIRVRMQTTEHSSVSISMVDQCALPLPVGYCPTKWTVKVKNPNHFLDVLKAAGKKNGFAVLTVRTADELTAALNGLGTIETVHYFGHSDPTDLFLQYSTTGRTPAVGEVLWNKTNAAGVKAATFAPGATFATYGCNQGEAGGLAESLRKLWGIRTIGSEGKTDFETIGRGETFPKSAGGYYEYPAPTLNKDGKTLSYPARLSLAKPF